MTTPHLTLVNNIQALANNRALTIVALAGPPGSGKSTLSAQLHKLIKQPCSLVPMDGFHLANKQLIKRGLLAQKGAPETFDLVGFKALLKGIKAGHIKQFPTFDRDADKVVEAGGTISPNTKVLIVEGNYLLFNEPGWSDLTAYWDASIWVDVPPHILEQRLIQRWLDQGLSLEAATTRAQTNDMVNMQRIQQHALPATWVVRQED